MEQATDEGRTASGDTALLRRPKPAFLTIGEGKTQRQLCPMGKFCVSLGVEYVTSHRDRWIAVGELARVFYGANTPSGKEKIRRRLFELANDLLVSNRAILLYEFDGRRISAVKVYDADAEIDRQTVILRIDRMARKCQWTQSQYELVRSVVKVEAQLHGRLNLEEAAAVA